MRRDQRIPLLRQGDDVASASLVLLQRDEVPRLCILEEVRERAIPVVLLVELGMLPLDGLLHHRAPDDLLVLAQERADRIEDALERLLLLLREVLDLLRVNARARFAHEVLIEDELV